MNLPKIYYLLIIFSLNSLSNVFSQETFIKSYGGTDVEIPSRLIQYPDSGFVMVGHTRYF